MNTSQKDFLVTDYENSDFNGKTILTVIEVSPGVYREDYSEKVGDKEISYFRLIWED